MIQVTGARDQQSFCALPFYLVQEELGDVDLRVELPLGLELTLCSPLVTSGSFVQDPRSAGICAPETYGEGCWLLV